jgi:hypothetical protein
LLTTRCASLCQRQGLRLKRQNVYGNWQAFAARSGIVSAQRRLKSGVITVCRTIGAIASQNVQNGSPH